MTFVIRGRGLDANKDISEEGSANTVLSRFGPVGTFWIHLALGPNDFPDHPRDVVGTAHAFGTLLSLGMASIRLGSRPVQPGLDPATSAWRGPVPLAPAWLSFRSCASVLYLACPPLARLVWFSRGVSNDQIQYSIGWKTAPSKKSL